MPKSRAVDRRVPRARGFRRNPTDAERKLWQHLRQLPCDLVHFRRQATIGPYFADFACHTRKVVIELDGGQHAESASDAVRTEFLQSQGYQVLRFWNKDVLRNIDGVTTVLYDALNLAPPTPDPSPPHERGEGNGQPLTSDPQ